jgi:glycosyltransferase involved in cell wall biosynthesis
MSLRVLSIGSLPPEWGGAVPGGVATFHAALAQALAPGTGGDAEIVGIATWANSDAEEPVPRRSIPEGEPRTAFLGRVVAELRPDAVLLQHFANDWGLTMPTAAPGLPLVGVAHSWHNFTMVEDPGEREQARRRTQEAMDGLAVMVVGSEFTYREGLQLGLRYPPRTVVIPYPLQQAFAAPIDVGGPRSGVAFTGSLMPRKNVPALLESIALLPDLTVTVCGVGPDAAALGARAGELGLGDRAKFPGFVELENLRALLATREVLCLPSHSESFGLVFIEALSCGTPVVGFGPTLVEIARIMGIAIGEPVDPITPEALAAAIERVRARDWDRELLRRATLRAFSIDAIAARYGELLADAAELNPAASNAAESAGVD